MSGAGAKALFSAPCAFAAGVAAPESLPNTRLPEFAFVGRSNVGKSSLLNALVGSGRLARVSANPGCTRQLNFFDLGGRLYLVDMPGYGYAKASKREIEHWGKFMPDYLRGRKQIRRIFLLLDARRGAGENDEQMMRILDDAAQTYQIILTKADKLKPAELQAAQAAMQEVIARHPAAFPGLITTSAQTKEGIETLRAAIAGLI
jgi:GTP-binding protein